MLEIMPESEYDKGYVHLDGALKEHHQFKRFSIVSTQQASEHSEDLIEQLLRIKKKLLLKSNRSATRFTISRGSGRYSAEQVKVLASMLPDELIHSPSDYQLREFEGAVFFADISGFTDLSAKYSNLDNGASKLSMVLNFYLGTMVQEILSHGGDIIKYSGDAFLAIFKAENEGLLQEVVHRAIDTAIIIQENCKNYRTEVGVVLNVKIAISGGTVTFSLIGNEHSSHYAMIGDPVWQVKALQEKINPGEILVTPKAWFYIQETLYEYLYMRSFRYYKVAGFKDHLGIAQRAHEAILNFDEMKHKLEKTFDANSISSAKFPNSSAISSAKFEPSVDPYFADLKTPRDSYSLRQSINSAMNNKATQFFRRFIIRPLLNAIDLDESIDFLTEMRHVVIVFANFIVPRTTASDLIDILNRIYIDLCSIVSRYEGIVNKVSLFDKDMMFLIIFGLRGFKHNMESQIALRCADEIHETFKLWPEVITVSIAVTSSGASYCGVIGHTLRREYSVISVTVNKAARFMMAYTDVVSCDRETMMHSQMDLKHFTLLPARHMKGLSEEVVAYAFKEIEDSQFVERPVEYKTPVLGRNDILLSSRCHLIMAILNHNYVACEMEPHEHHISCFVIKGDTQQGKTRILDELFNMCFKNNLRCIKLTLHPKQLMKPYSTIALIMTRLLKNLDNDNVQNLIAEKLHDLGIDEYLSVLNPVFNINFEPSDIIQLMNNEQLMEIRQHVFKVLIETVTDEFWAILIDDLEYSDQESFTLFKTFFKTNSVFMFLSVGRRWRISKAQMKVLHNRHVMHHQIEPIANEYQKALACLYLNVSALSLELEKFLYANSCGIPGWIKTCMMKLLQSKKIEIRIISIRQATGMDHTIQNQELEKCQSLTEIEENLSNEWDMFNQCFIDDYKIQTPSESDDQLIRVAVLTQQIVASDFIGNLSIDSDLMVYDSLSAYDQLVCKCASSLGLEFSRAMLLYVISNSTDRLIGMAMVKMFEIHIFTCGSAFSSNEKKGSDIFVCNCKNCKVPESCRDLPKYASCALIKFHSENFRKCVYDSLTDKLRLEYHTRSLNYLYHKTRRCDPCGNAPFPILVAQDLDFEFIDGYYMTKNNSLQRMVNHFESLNLPIVAYHKNSIATNLLRRKKEMKFRSIVLNYMNYDFLDCKCNTILLKTFNNAIDHCYGAEQTVKLIESRIELASVCIKTSNIPRAQSLLKQAQIELNGTESTDGSRYSTFLRGRAFSLQGACLASLMQYDESIKLHLKACKVFHINFPRKYNFFASLKYFMVIKKIRNCAETTKLKQTTKLASMVTIQLSKTLSSLFEVFLATKKFCLAKLAAYWGLWMALRFDRHFSILARNFANVFKIISSNHSRDNHSWITKIAFREISRSIFFDGVDMEGLTAVVRMYTGIMMCQISKKEISTAIQLGITANNIALQIQNRPFQCEIVPVVFQLMMDQKRFQDAHTFLNKFCCLIRNDHDAMIWYYALCMDMMVDINFKIVSYETCYQWYSDRKASLVLSEGLSRFYANMFLWATRRKLYENAQKWMEWSLNSFNVENSFVNSFTGMRIMEALTLMLHASLTLKNVEKQFYLSGELKNIILLLENNVKAQNYFRERFELHRKHAKTILKPENYFSRK